MCEVVATFEGPIKVSTGGGEKRSRREIIEWKENEDVMDGELNRCENGKKKKGGGGSILKDKTKDYRR